MSADGTIGVSHYDVRGVGRATRTLPTNVWLVQLRKHGHRRVGECRLAGPFDFMRAPKATDPFLGDYEGLTLSGSHFAALFAVATDDRRNRSDIVFTLR